MPDKIKIAIVDDNSVLLHQLSENLSAAGIIDVLFTASNGSDLMSKLVHAEKLPDLILMDIEMPVMNGIEATKVITQETGIKVLILTVFDNDDKIFEAIKAGASGYLLKDSKSIRIVNAIEDVMDGGAPMSPHIASKTLALLRNNGLTSESVENPADYNLSERECQLLELLVSGLTYKQIGEKLFISHGTVRKHIENIYGKLRIHTKLEAVNKAQKNNWFSSRSS
ncbi:MAG: response regulator transcription factor [Ferruginibacter sp.]